MKTSIPVISGLCKPGPGVHKANCMVVRICDVPKRFQSALRLFLTSHFGGVAGKSGILKIEGVRGDCGLVGNVESFFGLMGGENGQKDARLVESKLIDGGHLVIETDK